MYGSLMAIKGDCGARDIITENPGQVLSVEVCDPTEFADIDTAEDLAKIQRLQ
jgi:CTP:molybdopterin cytidylyltransferase MocA